MASVFYLVIMFMLCTMMGSNNNLHCEAASNEYSVDEQCWILLSLIENQLLEKPPINIFGNPFGPTSPKRPPVKLEPEGPMKKTCTAIPKTSIDVDLCKCKMQERFRMKIGDSREESPLLKVLNALDRDEKLRKSCGFKDDCDTVFRSVESKCQTEAREAMKTCAPMVKAASEYRLGNRTTQTCCSLLNKRSCQCNTYKDKINNTPESRGKTFVSEALQSLNDTLRDKCGIYSPVCEQSQDPFSNERRGDVSIKWRGDVVGDCVVNGFDDLGLCAEFLPKSSRMQANDLGVEEAPLVDFISRGCCLDRESCKCDPRSVSCCQKLGELSKKGRDGCMCELLNSKTTPDSTLEFLNFVRARRNYILKKSCQSISTVYTDTCAPPLPSIVTERRNPSSNRGLNRGFNTRKNPNDRTIPT